jgi:hypothetical protein
MTNSEKIEICLKEAQKITKNGLKSICDFCAFLRQSGQDVLLSLRRSILPRSFFGRESTNSTQRGYL